MKKLIVCCATSALLGGALAGWLVADRPNLWPGARSAHAQDISSDSSERFGDEYVATQDRPLGVRADSTSPASSSGTLDPGLTAEELINIRVYDGASRGVANIVTQTVSYDRFFMLPTPGEGAGSGSVIDKNGHILTNNHVVEGAQTVTVTLSSGKEYTAEVVGSDSAQDIAVLKIDAPASELFPIPAGTSDNLRVGQRVYTLGNPFGLEGTLTTGIISNLNRTLPSRVENREMKSIIQTDAAMNPGNSGGPLLDTHGRMIGMNVAIATKTGQSAGLGFAIPVNRIRQIVPELIKYGKYVRADIGIVAVAETDKGLQIVQTNRGGPAEKAGLRGWQIQRRASRGPLAFNARQVNRSAADVILAVDGQPIDLASAFLETIEEHRPGDQIVLTILREGKTIQVPITLAGT